MRIFKNKIIFFVFFLRPMRPGGIIEVPQIWLYFPLVSGSGGQISLQPPIFNLQITQILDLLGLGGLRARGSR